MKSALSSSAKQLLKKVAAANVITTKAHQWTLSRFTIYFLKIHSNTFPDTASCQWYTVHKSEMTGKMHIKLVKMGKELCCNLF
jgi:hypothetical protein